MNTRKAKAEKILAEVDAMFHHCEKENPKGEVTYLDMIRIGDRIKEHFDKDSPEEIDAGLDIAVGMVHPSKLEGVHLIKKGLGALVSLGGGISLMLGILYIMAFGVTATSIAGMLWWKTSTVSILFGGPLGIVIGIASLAVGIYIIYRSVSLKKRIAVALDVIRKAVRHWAQHGVEIELPDMSWVTKMPAREYNAFVALMWNVINADKHFAEAEAVLMEHIIKIRKPGKSELVTGIAELDIEEAADVLKESKYAQKCISAISSVPAIDGEASPAETKTVKKIEMLLTT